jgi:hypothetical protein
MNDITRIDRATVKFFDGLEVDGYRMPNGDFRVGITGASQAIGFSKGWLSQVHSREGEALKALQGLGFTGSQQIGTVEREGKSGSSQINTISLDDFALLILYGAMKGKKQAIALQLSLTKMSINDFFREAFGERQLSVEEKRAEVYKKYASTINWLAEDRREWALIEEQELFLAGSWA